jgi:hypothetical protein
MDLACGYFLEQKKLTIHDLEIYDRIFKIPLQFMEEKGFLVSTEINSFHIQILPNLRTGIYDSCTGRFCWCNKG